MNQLPETSADRTLFFQDARPPNELRFELERRIMRLFTASLVDGRLLLSTRATIVGNAYDFALRFEAAWPSTNCYGFRMTTSWADAPATHHDYYRKTSGSWFELFTRELTPIQPVEAIDFATDRYRSLCDDVFHADNLPQTVESIQETIIAAMKAGRYFATSHKEGGSHLRYQYGIFTRTDHGDDPGHNVYPTTGSFLAALRQFCDPQVTRHTAGKIEELDAWKLILRLLEPR
jgi:hypothetical protein